MSSGIVTPNLQTLIRGSKIAVLAQTKVWAVRAHKTSTNYWFHIASYTFVLTVCSQAISQQGHLYTLENVALT